MIDVPILNGKSLALISFLQITGKILLDTVLNYVTDQMSCVVSCERTASKSDVVCPR